MSASTPILPAAFDIVDAQLHLSLDMPGEKILAAMDTLGIRGVIVDEFWGINPARQGTPCASFADGAHRPLSPYAQAAALLHPQRVAYLQRVDRRDPQLACLIPVLATSPGCRALRIVLLEAAERQAFAAGGYDQVLTLAQEHGLPVCVMGVDTGALPQAATRHPDLTFVLDHCGWPRSPQHWDEILQLARLSNVYMKWSHALRAFGRAADPGAAVQREFLRAIDAFGARRVLWASDATHEESGATLEQLLSFVRDNPALAPDDKAWVLGGAARQVFGWEAPAAAAAQG
ncbi:MAG: amidohydrolase family protein [Pseudomonadota bacterium]